VTVEVTESAAITTDLRRERLDQIAATGVGIAADDFGAGYASYAALSELPFTTVKIDISLIRGLADPAHAARAAAQVGAIIEMAGRTGLTVVAEGIESEEQAQILTTLGCERGQGFLFARPLPVRAAEDLVVHPMGVAGRR